MNHFQGINEQDWKNLLKQVEQLSPQQKSELIYKLLQTSGVKVVMGGVSEVFSVKSEIFLNIQSLPIEQMPELLSLLIDRLQVRNNSETSQHENDREKLE